MRIIDEESVEPAATNRRYWNHRARIFASDGSGMRATGSFGMPNFYNRSIDATQTRALRRELAVSSGDRVLDVGCGIGRWSRRLAELGAEVVGVDHSVEMVREARQRTARSGLDSRCRYLVADVSDFTLRSRFDLIVCVTVLQHVAEERVASALHNLRSHLDQDGKIVLLEAAPERENRRCDSSWFWSRTFRDYQGFASASGLRLVRSRGVDPVPLKIWLLPYYRAMPALLARSVLLASTLFSLPLDLALKDLCRFLSWHRVLVLEHAR